MLQSKSDTFIMTTIKKLAKNEQLLTSKVIQYLDEIDRRKLFSDLRYPSLHAYCVKELGYSEGEAWRRIDAMRLARKVPLVKEKIATGELTLTKANELSSFIKQQGDDRSNLKDENRKFRAVQTREGRNSLRQGKGRSPCIVLRR
jgi:hypothetical protein